jgi:hypothetical protein
MPGVKSISEQGVAGYELVGWTVVFAPRGSRVKSFKHSLLPSVEHLNAQTSKKNCCKWGWILKSKQVPNSKPLWPVKKTSGGD